MGIRLPCRFASQFSFGDDATMFGQHAWFVTNSNKKTGNDGSKPPNDFGLFDMHGHLNEWCEDWFSESYPSEIQTDPLGPTEGRQHAIRGGSINSTPAACRSSYRRRGTSASLDHIGFRIVRELD